MLLFALNFSRNDSKDTKIFNKIEKLLKVRICLSIIIGSMQTREMVKLTSADCDYQVKDKHIYSKISKMYYQMLILIISKFLD